MVELYIFYRHRNFICSEITGTKGKLKKVGEGEEEGFTQ